jgi:hypothetical protein
MKKGLLVAGALLTLFLAGCEGVEEQKPDLSSIMNVIAIKKTMSVEPQKPDLTSAINTVVTKKSVPVVPHTSKIAKVPVKVAKGISLKNTLVSKSVDLVRENVRLASEEDLEGYLRTLKNEIATSADAKSGLEALFKNFDLTYKITSITIKAITKEAVEVVVVSETTAVKVEEGFDYKNRIETTTNTLIKEGGHLVYSETKLDNVKYLP